VSVLVNDIHSRLNPTRIAGVRRPRTVAGVVQVIRAASASGQSVSIGGGRHSMGGQAFLSDGVLIDMRSLDRVRSFDPARGLITVEAGIQWPALVGYLQSAQQPGDSQWGIVQKQTGADALSLGGALASNVHGRGLSLKPIVDQIESFKIIGADGVERRCSREAHADLFALAIGGYGLFGVVTEVTLRLRPRVKVRRDVTLADAGDVTALFESRIRDGYLYGDFQFAIDSASDAFLRRGVLSCYQPVPIDTPLSAGPAGFCVQDWTELTVLAHADKSGAFEKFASRYLETAGQIYWGDAQLADVYIDNYHDHVDRRTGATCPGSEMITEIFVDRARLSAFLEDARAALIDAHADVIYGTIRLIEKDDETFLAWAKDRCACIVFNLHVDHEPAAVARAAETFRALIDLAIRHGGGYYLTYHRWARRNQVEAAYPRFREFLARKVEHDPAGVFQSDWYRHYRAMFA